VFLLAPAADTENLSPKAADVLRYLQAVGASFMDDIVLGARRLRAEVEEGLWELVAAGRVTADGFAALRSLLPSAFSPGGGSARRRWYGKWTRQQARSGMGRWSLLRSPLAVADPAAATDPTAAGLSTAQDDRLELLARQYVKRWGVVFRDLLRREPQAPPWRDLVRVYRRLEMRGEMRGGRLVGGFVGEQFATPEAVESLRAIRRSPRKGEVLALSACDPLNLVGLITPGARIPTTLANTVVYKDGVPTDEAGHEAAVGEINPYPMPPRPSLSAG
jgi:ATP-dependent helicase Lhr and Lhr-like helicase